MTYSLADRAAAEGCPVLEVRRVALNDGSHASLILENGRISKLVSPSGEVARLQWEEEKPSPRQPCSTVDPAAETASRWCAPKMQEGESFVSARQFWASMPEAPRAQRKPKGSTGGHSSVVGCSTRGPSDTSEVASPSPRVTSAELPIATTQPAQPEAASQVELDRGNSGQDHKDSELSAVVKHGFFEEPTASCPTDSNDATASVKESEVPPADQGSVSELDGAQTDGSSAPAESHSLTDDCPAAPFAKAASTSQNYRGAAKSSSSGEAVLPLHKPAVQPEEGPEPESAAAQAGLWEAAAGQLDAKNQLTSAVRSLEALMGDAPKLDMRRMRAEVAELPQLVSAAERAEIAAGARVRRSSRAAQPRRQPAPAAAAAAQRPADSDGDAWPPRCAIFEPCPADPRPATALPAPSTAEKVSQQEFVCEAASRGSAGVSRGETVASPAVGNASVGTSSGESADGSAASGPSAHSVTSATRRRHSLADIRRAIAALPSGAPSVANQSAGSDMAAALLVPATLNTTAKPHKKAKNFAKPKVWRKITAAFHSRRVQPQSGSDPGSPAARPGSPGSCSSSNSCTRRSLAQRLFGAHGFRRRASACSEAHLPKAAHPAHSPLALMPAPVELALPAVFPSHGGAFVDCAAVPEEREGKRAVEQGCITPTSVTSRSSTRRRASHHEKAQRNRTGMAGRWRLEPCERALAGMEEVEALLDLPLLQRLAMHRADELHILETDEALTIVQDIPLNGSGARIRRRSVYPKGGSVVEEARSDSREGVLRSQLTISPDGHLHIRSLQGDPYAAVFHKRIKISSGGHRIKVEQKFQLLAPGVLPVKYHSIWHRIEEENSPADANAAEPAEVL